MQSKLIVTVILAGLIAGVAIFIPLEQISLYLNPAGLVLVVGGTLAGALIAYPLNSLRNLWRQICNMREEPYEQEEMVELFTRLSDAKRKDGVRALEQLSQESGNIFLQMGVAMVVDNHDRADIRGRLEQELDMFITKRESEIAVLSLMGRLAPAFGLAGTVVGLIRMLHGLSDPNLVASGMSVALLTTFYGIMLANLIVLPLERKLRERLRQEAVAMTIIGEGVWGLALDENKTAIASRLRSYRFAPQSKEGAAELYLDKAQA